VLLRDDACTGAALNERLETMLTPETLLEMASAAGTLGRARAAEAIAAVVLSARGER
jgi:UDP-N-acetylglucosamine:LPS N-acetylglucosamine transferase